MPMVHPIFKSADDGNLAFQNGQVDVMQQFTPQIWKMRQDAKAPVGTWFDQEPYYIAAHPHAHHQHAEEGPDNPLVRRALAYSINYPLIAQTAMSRYSVPANASLIIPGGGENQFFNADQVKADGWTYDPAKAKDIRENQLKATKGSDGVYTLPYGTRLGPGPRAPRRVGPMADRHQHRRPGRQGRRLRSEGGIPGRPGRDDQDPDRRL